MKYLLLDVAGTILYKPQLYSKISGVLNKYGYEINTEKIELLHKLLSEVIKFPDRTDKDFYIGFNSELLYLLGIVPDTPILNDIFDACSYLPWQKYNDTAILNEVEIPMGVISNFNSSLSVKLDQYFGPIFLDIFVSENMGIAKPSILFYKTALNKINVNPEEILYIGDSFKLDFKPATELGMKVYIIDRQGLYVNNPNTISTLETIKSLIS